MQYETNSSIQQSNTSTKVYGDNQQQQQRAELGKNENMNIAMKTPISAFEIPDGQITAAEAVLNREQQEGETIIINRDDTPSADGDSLDLGDADLLTIVSSKRSIVHESAKIVDHQSTAGSDATKPSTEAAGNSADVSSVEDDGNSTDAIADAFSSSLAYIAATGGRNRDVERLSVSSSNDTPSSRVAAALVSATTAGTGTQTSSGDDRDSSACDGERKRSSQSDSEHLSIVKRQSPLPQLVPLSLDARAQRIEVDDRPHYHRHRRSHHTSTVKNMKSSNCGATIAPSSESPKHATVEAHRLPLTGGRSAGSSFDPYGAYSSSGGETERALGEISSSSLLQPYREPCFHTIRQTFKKFVKRASRMSSPRGEPVCHECSTSAAVHKRAKRGVKRQPSAAATAALLLTKKRSLDISDRIDGDMDEDESGISSGSGTEGGYGASNSSNGNVAQSESCSSPSSEDSSEDSGNERKRRKGQSTGDPLRPMLSKKRELANSVSSEIADFSSSYSLNAYHRNRSDSPSLSSSSNLGSNHQIELPGNVTTTSMSGRQGFRQHRQQGWSKGQWKFPNGMVDDEVETRRQKKRNRFDERKPAPVGTLPTEQGNLDGKPPIIALGCDVMAHVLTFLEPPDILDVLTMPLSKDWLNTFTRQPELWRVLCLLEPFKAQVDDEDAEECDSGSSDDDSIASSPFDSELTVKRSKFRLLYTSYVRCMRCLIRIKDDAINGRPLSVIDYAAVLGGSTEHYNLGANHNLQQFLSRARGIVSPSTVQVPEGDKVQVVADASPDGAAFQESTSAFRPSVVLNPAGVGKPVVPIKQKKLKLGRSDLSQRRLSATLPSNFADVELPWSCGIYSIVNWMLAFTDVEGIQTMCLRVLPFLLENEQQRITAQRAGLTDIVLRGMVLFPESAMLHTTAFHTIVLLARPLGGQEGMLFHTSMVNSSGIFSSNADGAASGRSGIAVLLDSMRRFQSDEVLQSMACWSLVNIALAPAQKEVLVKLGGIEVILNAMMEHQYCAEVQFRALFALINLVIPSVTPVNGQQNIGSSRENGISDSDSTEKEILDDLVEQIINLVVLSMRNFCSNEAILNRACLVLHNVSLAPCYHCAMLWTPNCYQMLEWCLRNYRTDQVLQQSAAGTLHRLQMTLSSDGALRARFAASLQAQQKQSLEQAHREAIRLRDQAGEHASTHSVQTPEMSNPCL